MIKLYTSFTKEIDSPKDAIKEILEQLNPEKNMLKNTIGIIHFYHDFAKAGIWEQFLDVLPFELAGCASSYTGASGQHGDVAVSVTMLTSDDSYFVVRTIDDLDTKTIDQVNKEVTHLYGELCAEEKPKMIMPFLPPIPHCSITNLYFTMNGFDKDVFLFGMQAFNITGSYDTNFVFANSKMSVSMCAFVAFYGNIKPDFHIGSSFLDENSLWEEAVITESDGSLLKSINGISAVEYFKRKGIISSKNKGAGIMTIPALITYQNGTKTGCAFLGIVKDTEYVFAARTLQDGAKITFTDMEGEKILTSAEAVMEEINTMKRNDLFICISAARAWSLGSNFFAELQKIYECAQKYEKENGEPLRYSAVYTGSELCPIRDKLGNYKNMPHNYTFTICSLN